LEDLAPFLCRGRGLCVDCWGDLVATFHGDQVERKQKSKLDTAKPL
jgi:hypothetical protein